MLRYAARAAIVAVLPLALACEHDDNPAGPRADPARNVIVFNDPSGALRAHEGTIRDLLDATFARAGGELPITDVTVTITSDASRAIPGWGIGGFTTGANSVDLHIDAGYPDLAQLLESRLPPLAAHELHHVVRVRGPGYGATLLGALVSEGLADQFALELYGGSPPPWVVALEGTELEHWLAEAEEEFDSISYDHEAWFFGNGVIPNWTGYAIGHRLVVDYQASHPGDSAAELVNTPAEAFRPD